jgi:ABC-type uncharacterized transport system permease subunit
MFDLLNYGLIFVIDQIVATVYMILGMFEQDEEFELYNNYTGVWIPVQAHTMGVLLWYRLYLYK